jgi:arylsulfatase A-like enzyme
MSTGVSYAAAYFAVEISGSLALTAWLGFDATMFELVGRDLLGLLLQYVLLGACLGLLVHPIVRRLEPLIPPQRFVGSRGIAYGLLTLAFAVLAWLWNAESVLPRLLYVEQAIAADLLIVICLAARFGIRRIAGWMGVHVAPWVPRTIGALLILVVLGTVAYRAANSRSPGKSSGSTAQRTAAQSPNVLVIVVDTLRRDHLSTYGYTRPTSPRIDRIASQGAVFEKAFTPAPWTLPAHASLFTGLYPATHLTDSGETRLDPSVPTLAAALQASGYRTASFVANAWVTAATGLDRGFDRVEFFGADGLIGSSFIRLATERLLMVLNLNGARDTGGRALTARLSEWIRESKASDKPFFAFANYMEAHEPYGTVPDSYFSSYLDAPVSSTIGRQWLRDTPVFLCSPCSTQAASNAADGLTCVNDRWDVSARRQADATALYDAGIRFIDDQIGAIDDLIAQLGILDNTLVIVTGDHGESLGEHDTFGHGALLYNEVLRVPLVVRYPKAFTAGSRVDTPVSLLDIFPTVQEIAGLPGIRGLQGNSLRDQEALAGRPARVFGQYAPVPERVWRTAGTRLQCDYHRAGRRSLSLQTTSFKYIWSSDGRTELYDVVSDPGETRNVAESEKNLAAALHQDLFGWLSKVESASGDRVSVPVDPGTRKRLESLGYIR